MRAWPFLAMLSLIAAPAPAVAAEAGPVLVAPWAPAPADAYVVRYFPGVTFRQGPAPVRPTPGAAPAPALFDAPALGVGLEGRSPTGHGWQLLANWSSSPLAPAPDPRLVLHGFWLPHHDWGFDADVGLDPRGSNTTELGTSLLFGPDQRLRLGLGRQAGIDVPGYGYGQASLTRDFPALGLSASVTGFCGQDGAAQGGLDAWQAWSPSADMRLAANASAGVGDTRLPAGRRLGVGLVSAGGTTADARLAARGELAVPLARRLGWGWAPLATLAHVEGAIFMEGALARGTSDGRDGPRAGLGVQLDFVADTGLGLPLTLGLGAALPLGPDPVPRFYVGTSGVRFAR